VPSRTAGRWGLSLKFDKRWPVVQRDRDAGDF
jgi:hypothetical protein